jgi:drug/metabolite transporter (DMT)-like permease
MAVAIALSAAACWGLADFLAGLASRRVAVILVLLLIQLGGFAVIGAITLATRPAWFTDNGDALLALGGGLAGVLGLGLFYRALAIGTMSVVAPISASGVALPVVVGLATGDRPSPIAAAGLAAIVVGVILASREVHEDEDAARAGRASVLLALASAVGFGAFFALTDAPADDSKMWTLVLARGAALPFLIALVVAHRPRLPAPRLGLGIALVGTIDLAATALIVVANTKGDLSVVSVLGSMYPVTTVLLAAAFLHERLLPPQLAGVGLALGGVALVAAG